MIERRIPEDAHDVDFLEYQGTLNEEAVREILNEIVPLLRIGRRKFALLVSEKTTVNESFAVPFIHLTGIVSANYAEIVLAQNPPSLYVMLPGVRAFETERDIIVYFNENQSVAERLMG